MSRRCCEQGLAHTASQLERVVRGYRRAAGTRLEQEQRRQARWGWDEHGMLVLTARLPAEEGALLVAALERARTALTATPADPDCPADPAAEAAGCAPGERPDPDELATAADAVVAVAQAALAAGDVDSSGDDEHLVVLHADIEVLTSKNPPAEADCRIEHGPGVEPATAERISCDAAVIAVLRTADPGLPLRLGRKTRKIPPALRRALRIRDERCQFPGCHRRTHLQAHHVQHWARGGRTDPENLILLCRRHHMAVHEGGFTITGQAPDCRFHRPDGISIPDTRDLAGAPIPAGDQPARGIRAQQTGERFRLADSIAALFGT